MSEDVDLARHTPGELARRQANELRRAAPLRSLLARLVGVRTEEWRWRRGAVGEERVGADLTAWQARDPRWRVLHAVPVGTQGSDIDHVVIGPPGVFTLNTKHHAGATVWVGGDTIMVNGRRQPYVRKSRHEASRAAHRLSTAVGFPVEVTPLIVLVGYRVSRCAGCPPTSTSSAAPDCAGTCRGSPPFSTRRRWTGSMRPPGSPPPGLAVRSHGRDVVRGPATRSEPR